MIAQPSSPASGSPPTVRSVGNFELLTPLAEGGGGRVWKARHSTTREIVALKTAVGSHPLAIESLHREILSLTQLSHPGVVRIVDAGFEDGNPWYAMELLEGPTLRQLLPLTSEAPPNEVALRGRAERMAEICEPLEYLHASGIVHGDLKPENIILTARGPTLVDFGLSAAFRAGSGGDLVRTVELAGTASYVSPEQAQGRHLDARSDIYSLGCILFEAVTGRPPFAATTTRELLAMHVNAVPDAPSAFVKGLPADLDKLVLQLLAKEPERRIASAIEVACRLASCLQFEPPTSAGRSVPRLFRAKLEGRAAQVGELHRLLRDGREGRGGLVEVVGSVGSGRSRILLELAATARQRGFHVLSGRAAPGDQHPLQALKGPVLSLAAHRPSASTSGEAPRALQLAIPELVPATMVRPMVLPGPDELARRVSDEIVQDVKERSKRRPTILLLDDVDDPGEILGHFLACSDTSFRDHPVLVVVSRSTEGEEMCTASIRLGPLDARETAAMVCSLLGVADLPSGLLESIMSVSSGVPLFVYEFVTSLLEQGLLRRDERGHWCFNAGDRGELPISDLTPLLMRRIRCLPEASRSLIEVMTVLEESTTADLERVSGLKAEEFSSTLSRALQTGLLKLDEHRVRIRSRAIAVAVRKALGPMKLRHLQCLSARCLAWTASDVEAHQRVAELARSAGLGPLAERALLKGLRLSLRHLPARSEELARQYLEIAPGSVESISVRNDLGSEVLMRQGRLEEAEKLHREAVGLSVTACHGEAELQSLMFLGLACQRQGKWDDAEAQYRSVAAQALERGSPRGRASALQNLGSLLMHRGDFAQSESCLREALRLTQEEGYSKGECYSALALGQLLFHCDRHGAALACVRSVLELEEPPEARILVQSEILRSRMALLAGELEQAEECLAVAASHAGTGVADAFLEVSIRLHQSRVRRLVHGSSDLAAESLGLAEDLISQVHSPFLEAHCKLERAALTIATGENAGEYLERAEAIAESLSLAAESEIRRRLSSLVEELGKAPSDAAWIRGDPVPGIPGPLRAVLSEQSV